MFLLGQSNEGCAIARVPVLRDRDAAFPYRLACRLYGVTRHHVAITSLEVAAPASVSRFDSIKIVLPRLFGLRIRFRKFSLEALIDFFVLRILLLDAVLTF